MTRLRTQCVELWGASGHGECTATRLPFRAVRRASFQLWMICLCRRLGNATKLADCIVRCPHPLCIVNGRCWSTPRPRAGRRWPAAAPPGRAGDQAGLPRGSDRQRPSPNPRLGAGGRARCRARSPSAPATERCSVILCRRRPPTPPLCSIDALPHVRMHPSRSSLLLRATLTFMGSPTHSSSASLTKGLPC